MNLQMKILRLIIFGLMSFLYLDLNGSDSNSNFLLNFIAKHPKVCAGIGYVFGTSIYQKLTGGSLYPIVNFNYPDAKYQGLLAGGFAVYIMSRSENASVVSIQNSHPFYCSCNTEKLDCSRNIKSLSQDNKITTSHALVKYIHNENLFYCLTAEHRTLAAGAIGAGLLYGASVLAARQK